MPDAFVIEMCAVISAIAATLSCVGFLVLNFKISIVHRETNSMKDELVKAARAEGARQGKDDATAAVKASGREMG